MSIAGNDGSVSAPVGSSTSSASLARLPRSKESGTSGSEGEGGGRGGGNVKIGRNPNLTRDRIYLVPNIAESDSYLRAFNPTLDPSTSTLPPSFNPGSMTAIPFYNGQGPVVSSPPVYTSDSFNFGSTSAIGAPFGQDVRSSSPSSASDSRRASSPATNSDGSPTPFIFGASVAGSAADSSPSSVSRRASFPVSTHIPFNFTPSTNSIPFNFTANTGSTASSFQRPPSSGASASSPATPFIFIPSTLTRFAAASGPAISFGTGGPIESLSTSSSPFAPTTFPVVSGDELLSATPFNYGEVLCSSPSQENDKTNAVDSAAATTGSGVAVDQSASTAASGSAVPINYCASVSAIPFVAATPLGPGPSTSDVVSSAAQPVTLETEDTTKAATSSPSGLTNGPTISDGGASPSLIDLDLTSLIFSDIPPEQPTSSGTGDVTLSSSTVSNSHPVISPAVSDGGTLLSSTSFGSSTGSDISGGQPVAFEAGVTIGGLSSVSSSSRHTSIRSSSQKFPNRPSAYKSASAGANHVNSRYSTGPAKMAATQKPVRKPPSFHSGLLGSQDSDDDESSSSSYSDDGNGDQSAHEPASTPNLLGSYAILPVSSSALPPVTAPKPPSPINPPTTTQPSPSVTPSALSDVASPTTTSGSSQSPSPPATSDILDDLLAAITSQGLAIRDVESSVLSAAPTSHRALPHAVLSSASMLTQTASRSSSTEISGRGAPTAILTHLSLLAQAAAISLPVSPTSSGAPASVSAGSNLMIQSADTCQSVSTSNVALADGIEGSASPSSGGGLLSEGEGEGLSSESEAPGQPGRSPGSSGSDSDSDSDSESNPPSNSRSPTLNPYEALVEAMMNWSVSCTSAASPVGSGAPRRVSNVDSIFGPQRELVSHYSYTAASLSLPPSYLQLGSVQPLPPTSGSPDTSLSEPLITNAPQIGNLAVLGTSAPSITFLVPSSTELASLSASSQPITSGAGGGNTDNMQPIPELTFVNQVTLGASITPIRATVTTLVSTAYDASASTAAAAAGLSSSNPLSQMTIASSTGHSAQGVIAPILSASSGSSGVPASAGSSVSSGSTTTASTTTTTATSTSATTAPIISAIAAVITPITTISVSTAGPGHVGARQPGGGIAPVGASASSSSTGQSSSTAPSINLRRHARDGESDMDIDDDNRHQNKRPLISSGSVATTPATTAVPTTASVSVSSAAPASTSGSSRPWWVTFVPGSGIRVNQPPVLPAPVPLVPPIWSSSSSASLSSSSQQKMSTQSLSLFPQQTQQTQSPSAQPAQSTHSACMQQMQQVHSGPIQQNQPIQSACAQQNPLVQSMQHPMQSTCIQNAPSMHSSSMPPIPFGQPLSTMQYIGPRIPTYPPPLAVQSSLRAAGYSAFLGSTTPELARPPAPSQVSTWFAPAQVSAWSAPVQASTWSAPKSPPPLGPIGPRPPPLLVAPVPPSLPVSPVPPPLPIVPAPLPTPVVSILPSLPVAPVPVPPPLPVVPLPPPLPVAPALPPGYVPSKSLPLLYSNLFPSNPPVLLQPLQPSQPSQPPRVAAPIIASNMIHLHPPPPPPPPPPPQPPTAVAPINQLPTVRLSASTSSFASSSFSPLPSLYGMPQPTSSSQLNPPPPLQSIPQPPAPPHIPGTFYRSVRPRLSGPSASLPPVQQQQQYPSAIIPRTSSWPVRPVPLVSTTMPHQPSVPAPPLSLGSYISLPRAGQSGVTLAPMLKQQQAASSAVHMGPLSSQQKQVCSSGAQMLPISTQQTSLFSSSMASAFSQPQIVSSGSGAATVSAFLQLPAGLSSPSIASTALPTSERSSWNTSPFSIAPSTNLHVTATATPPMASSQGAIQFGDHASIRAAPKFTSAPVLTTAPFSAPTLLPQAASPHALPPANSLRTFLLHPVPRGSSLAGSPPPSLSALSPSSGESRKDEEMPSNPSSPTLVNPIVSRTFGLAAKARSGSRLGTISGRVGSSGSDGRRYQANTLFSSAFSSMIANAIASLPQPTTTLSAFATTSATTATSSVATVAATRSIAVPVSPSLASISTTLVVPNLVVSTVASASTSSLTALASPIITTSFPTATTSSLVTASSPIASSISPTTTTPTFMSTASTPTISITTNIPSAARALGTACPPLSLASPVLTPSPLNSLSPTTSLTTISAATPLDVLYPTLPHHPSTPLPPAESSSQTNTTTTSPQQQPQQRHLSPVADQDQTESDAAAISQQMAHQHAIQHELVPKARLLEKEGQRDERLRWVQEQHAGTDAINVARRLSTDIIASTNREGRRNQHLTDYRIQSAGVTGRSSAGRSLVELSNLHQRVHAIAVAGMMGSPSHSATSSTVAIQIPPSQAPSPTQSPQPSSPQSPSPSTLTPATTVSPTVSPSASPRPTRTPFIDITASFTNSSILSQHPHIPPQPPQRPLPPITSGQPAIPSQRQSSLVTWGQGQEGGSTRGRGSTPYRRSPGSSRRSPTSLSTSLAESSAISSPRASQRPTPQGLVRSSPRSSPQGSTTSSPQSSGRSSPQSQSERRSRVCPSTHHTGLEESGPKESNIENRPVAKGSISSSPPSVNPTWSPSPVADVPVSRPFSPSGEVSDDNTTLVHSNQLSQQLTSSSPEHQDHEDVDSDSEEYYSASSQQGSITEDDDAQITQNPLDADDGSVATAPASLLGPGPSDDMGGGDILAGEAVAARLTTGTAPVTDAGLITGETVEISRGRLPTRSVRIQARTQSAVTPYGRPEPINTLRRSERIHQRNLRTATVPVEPAAVPRPTLASRARQVSTPTATAAADAPEVPEVRRSARIQQARELHIRRNCKHRIVKKSTVEKAKGNKKVSKKKK